LWDLASGVATDIGDIAAITCLSARRGNDPLIAATKSGHIQSLRDGRMKNVASLPAGFGAAINLAFAADGRTAVFGNKGGGLFAYDVNAGHGIGTFATRIEDVTNLAFLPDGVMLWVVGAGGNAELWDVRQGRPVAQVRCSPAGVSAFGLSPDGRHAVLRGFDGGAYACDFGRAATQHVLEERVAAARKALDNDPEPENGIAWAALGEWYAFHEKADWAIDFIRRADSQGGAVPRLAVACCYWLEGKHPDAQREFDLALERGEVSPRYHAMCTYALKHQSVPSSTVPTAPSFR
jgi:tetratricopeptide (TPR) repeat protein